MSRQLGMLHADFMRRCSSRELSEWIAFDRIEPTPDPWHQTGLLAALIYNAWFKGGSKRAEDFIPAKPAPRRDQTAAEGIAAFSAIAGAIAAAHDAGRFNSE